MIPELDERWSGKEVGRVDEDSASDHEDKPDQELDHPSAPRGVSLLPEHRVVADRRAGRRAKRAFSIAPPPSRQARRTASPCRGARTQPRKRDDRQQQESNGKTQLQADHPEARAKRFGPGIGLDDGQRTAPEQQIVHGADPLVERAQPRQLRRCHELGDQRWTEEPGKLKYIHLCARLARTSGEGGDQDHGAARNKGFVDRVAAYDKQHEGRLDASEQADQPSSPAGQWPGGCRHGAIGRTTCPGQPRRSTGGSPSSTAMSSAVSRRRPRPPPVPA